MQTISLLLSKFPNENRIVKGTFDRSIHPGPVTDILIKPIFDTINHPLNRLKQPLSGIFACNSKWLQTLDLPSGFGVDLQIMLFATKENIEIVEVDILNFEHKNRDWSHYISMSKEIVDVLLKNEVISNSYKVYK